MPVPELPTGTVTFLFTDLEGSTRLWQEHPDAMKDALARHDSILREAIAANGGHVVKMTGDGTHAAFASPADAVGAARDSQLALATEPWDSTGPLRVRMGIHTGHAEARDGDYYGTAVNKAARLMSVAHGGQIVVSLATEELLRDDGAGDCTLLDLGEHRLRDLADPERVFQLEHPGLERAFDPLRSLDAYRGNLPSQATSFVGREEEMRSIRDALASSRLVTVTGVGGVGKTRLAIQVAADLLPAFDDGAWLCELAAAGDCDAMTQVVAATLGVQPRAGLDLETGILDFLRAKELLLVLDNCEHLLDAAARFATSVLRESSATRVLATSREGLAIGGEQVWPLRSLVDDQAAALFDERARSVAPDVTIDAHDAAVAEICHRLDGIPLAIELAAARVVALGPTEIATRLDERFRLLTGGRRTAVERHQTLRATVDWSYSLLEASAQLVFARLGVFSGGFDMGAAEAVTSGAGLEPWDVVDAVTDLTAKSMVVSEHGASGTRYRLLETMRAYARERLDQQDDADAWRRRHAAHYADVAETIGPMLRTHDELATRQRLHLELDNLRAAVTWALDSAESGDSDLAARIIGALSVESQMNGVLGIGDWADRAVREGVEASTPELDAAVYGVAAWESIDRGAYERATDLALESLRLGESAQYSSMHLTYMSLACVDGFAGRVEPALAWMERAREHATAHGGDAWDLSGYHGASSFFSSVVGDFERGEAHAVEALRLARESGSPSSIVAALAQVGYSQWRDHPAAALAALLESIALSDPGAMNVMISPARSLAATIEARNGDARSALSHLRDAVTHSVDEGDNTTIFSCYDRAIRVFAVLGNHVPAAELAGVVTVGPFASLSTIGVGPEAEERDASLVDVRRELGDASFEAAVARGAGLSYEEILDRVLGEIDRMLEESG
jgi:predicted ATPase/class 3 adenylate cyclase